jgi:hypothetical protein
VTFWWSKLARFAASEQTATSAALAIDVTSNITVIPPSAIPLFVRAMALLV